MKSFCFSLLSVVAVSSLSGCGRQAPSETQVVNPETSVARAPAPWVMKSTVFLRDIQGGSTCSAVIVGAKRILTARHCVSGSEMGQDYEILVGVDLYAPGLVTLRGTGEVRKHPASDMATIDMESEFPYGHEPAPIHSDSTHFAPGNTAIVAGFGATSENDEGVFHGDFRYLRWGVLSFDKWLSEVTSAEGFVFRSVLRWRPGPSGSMFCRGDSGGPVFANFDGKWALVGINSLSETGCSSGGYTSDARPNARWILGQ